MLVNSNNMFHLMADHLNKTRKSIHGQLADYHKVALSHDKAIGKLLRNLTEVENAYLDQKLHLTRKKERLFPHTSKWEVEERLIENRRLNK